MNHPFKKIKDLRSSIIFLLCLGLIIGIPIYWFLLVPPALELQEIHQDSFTASGYFAPGGYFNLSMDTGKESLQSLHNGELSITPNLTNAQKTAGLIWQPLSWSLDQWPGSKEEIKYSSNQPLNGRMVLNVQRIDIPNQTGLQGQTIPIDIKYIINYPYYTTSTDVFGGSITKFGVKTETIEKTITIKLGNKLITKSELDGISINESWKKVVSVVIWISALLILLFFYSNLRAIETMKSKFGQHLRRLVERIKF